MFNPFHQTVSAMRSLHFNLSAGAHNQNRTGDLFLTKEVLYRLSHVGSHFLERVMGIEPTLSAWKAGVLPLNYTRANPNTQ
jgi:hypothetical protein